MRTAMPKRTGGRREARRGREPLAPDATVAWARYFLGRSLQLVGMLLVTGAAVLFFGANAERRMLLFTGLGAAVFVLGWFLARKRPQGAR